MTSKGDDVGSIKAALIGALVGAALGGAAVLYVEHAQAAKAALAASQHETRAVEAAREEEQRRTAAQTEIANDAQNQRTAALADAFAARADAGGLRQQVAKLLDNAKHSAATGDGAATVGPLDLLANVFGESLDRNEALAEYADRARIAGEECQRDYDALTGANPAPAASDPPADTQP
ncbi:DUF2514 family protein [Paraburkholderia sp. BR10936]|uniref:DUF2514 family protein n=1 Tax=Paraburkholderia sp. BR10936 TaxID=3236993 RepID=UPI0034D20BFA